MTILDENVPSLIIECRATYLEHLDERGGPRLQELGVVVDTIEIISSQIVGSLRHFVKDGPRLLEVILYANEVDSHPEPDVPWDALPTMLGPMCVCMCVAHKVHLLSHKPARSPDAYYLPRSSFVLPRHRLACHRMGRLRRTRRPLDSHNRTQPLARGKGAGTVWLFVGIRVKGG